LAEPFRMTLAAVSKHISFRVGGGYRIYFHDAGATCAGKLLEIVPDRKVVFTWGDEGSDEGFPRTRVSVELMPESDGTRTNVVILHTGFASREDAEGHDQGWCSGLEDLAGELVDGRIRLLRAYEVSRDVLYSLVKEPAKLFGPVAETGKGSAEFRVGGRYRFPTEKGQEIVPGGKIVFSWLHGCGGALPRPSRVTLSLDDEDDGASSLALVHEDLPAAEVKAHREGWEHLTAEFRKFLR
jgi:uncharacterized protein YndB with AHSA1/START domain